MAKKRMGRPPTSARDDIAIKYDRNLAADARYVAEKRGISLAEYLSELTRPMVAKDFHAVTKGSKP